MGRPKKGDRTSRALLKEYPKVKEWYGNLKRASPANADKCLQRLEYVRRTYHKTPNDIAKLVPSQAYSLILKVVGDLDSAGRQPTYQQDYVKSLKSWYSHNGKQISQKVKLGRSKSLTKVANEQSPTPDLLRKVLNAADLKQKVECVLVAFAGLRPEVIGSYLGDDGLKLADLPELELDNSNKTVSFTKVPAMITVRPSLSKAGHKYFSFMPQEGCDYIKQLLEYRMRTRGETLNNESPVVNSINHNRHYSHIRTTNIGDSIRVAIRKAGFDWRPYNLRTYNSTRLLLAQSVGLLDKDLRTFLFGHKGDMSARYSTNKGRLPEDVIERMRDSYDKASRKYLITFIDNTQDMTVGNVKRTYHRLFLTTLGFSEEEINSLGDLAELSDEKIRQITTEKSMTELGLSNGGSQKIIPLSDIEPYVSRGWEYVRDLPGDKCIIKLPKG